jgi:hypothetical protein
MALVRVAEPLMTVVDQLVDELSSGVELDRPDR